MFDTTSESRCATAPLERSPPAYRDRLQRMKNRSARARSQAGLWLLEYGLQQMGVDAGAMAGIGFGLHGRPEIDGGPAFSIAHSGWLVACAIAPGQAVGLDVEARRSHISDRLIRLMGRAATDDSPATDEQRFFDDWCAREATVKATGRVGLARIHEITLTADKARIDDRQWPLYPLDLAPGYAGCLASDRPIEAVEIVRSPMPYPA